MPEGDTVFRSARRLHQALAGRPLTVCDLRWGQAATLDLTGRDTLEVIPRGKHILHRIEGGWTIHSHLRMEGSWRILASRDATPRRLAADGIRAVVGTAQWVCLGVRLGMLDAVPTDREATLVGHLGPDVLGPDWDASAVLTNLLATPKRPIGEALLDQRNLAGVGTMYAAETLFLERTNPWAAVDLLATEDLAKLIRRAHRLLHANVEHAVPSTTGSRRRGQEKYAHGRSGLPCRRCGEPVRMWPIGAPPRDRTMFYCPRCQGGLAPEDDGRPQAPLGTSPSVANWARGYGADQRPPATHRGTGTTDPPPTGDLGRPTDSPPRRTSAAGRYRRTRR